MKPSKQSTISIQLDDIDHKYQGISNLLLPFREELILNKTTSHQLSAKLDDIYIKEETKKEVKELEDYLLKNYGTDLNNPGWHGGLSQQRIIWHDDRFIRFISNKDNILAILKMFKEGELASLGGRNNLGGAIIFGLISNTPGQIIGAAPHYFKLPPNPTADWDRALYDMRISESHPDLKAQFVPDEFEGKIGISILNEEGRARYEEYSPWKPTNNYIAQVDKALAAVSEVLSNYVVYNHKSNDVNSILDKCSPAVLLKTLKDSLKNESLAEQACGGDAGNCTELSRMNGQCLEVMSQYDKFSQDLSPEEILGYGMFSHALDARHLIAAIHGLETTKSVILYPKENGKGISNDIADLGRSNLNYLLQHMDQNDTLLALMKRRLQQSLAIVLEKDPTILDVLYKNIGDTKPKELRLHELRNFHETVLRKPVLGHTIVPFHGSISFGNNDERRKKLRDAARKNAEEVTNILKVRQADNVQRLTVDRPSLNVLEGAATFTSRYSERNQTSKFVSNIKKEMERSRTEQKAGEADDDVFGRIHRINRLKTELEKKGLYEHPVYGADEVSKTRKRLSEERKKLGK